MKLDPMEILQFWFEELSENEWFMKDDNIDFMISRRFRHHLQLAENGELFVWRILPEGRLAEIILLDQFSRNIYRGTSDAFRNDHVALALAQEMVLMGLDKKLPENYRRFVYMPFMHSESRLIHEIALNLFQDLGVEDALKYEELHKEVIERFGRFPHRNRLLGRSSTPQEHDYLLHNSGF